MSNEIKEAIKLLEEAQCPDILHCDNGIITNTFNNDKSRCVWCVRRTETLTILKPPECALCCDKKVVTRLLYEKVPCPECQPKAGEPKCKTGISENLSLGEIRRMAKKAWEIIDVSEAENKRLKKAIKDYGNNPAGFDWAVLEKIENQESINTDLLEACEKALRFGLNPSLEKIVQAVIAKVERDST